jgi:Cysteine rich repeat
MRKALPLLACLLCLTAMACKPEHAARGIMREQRMEQRGERGDRHGDRHGGLKRVCRSDIEQYCAADQKGRDRRECLESHMDKLSADCKTAVQERMNRHGGRRNRDQNNNNGGTTTNTNGANKDDDDN